MEVVRPIYILGKGFAVLIADLAKSRRAADRQALQEAALATVAALNDQFRDDLLTAIDMTRGDEIQAITTRPGATLEILFRLQEALRPVALHAGIGFGPLTTGARGTPVRLMDGPCFHNARAALDQGKRAGLLITVRGFPPLDDLLSPSLHLAAEVRASWSDIQRAYIATFRSVGSVAATAAQHQVTPSAVSQALTRSRLATVNRLNDAAIRLLDLHWRAPDGA